VGYEGGAEEGGEGPSGREERTSATRTGLDHREFLGEKRIHGAFGEERLENDRLGVRLWRGREGDYGASVKQRKNKRRTELSPTKKKSAGAEGRGDGAGQRDKGGKKKKKEALG